MRQGPSAGWLVREPRRLLQAGAGTFVDPSAQFIGAQRIQVGVGCAIGQDTWMNVSDWETPGPAIVVGDYSFIGRRNFFTCGAKLEIGAYCLTGPGVEILGADHGFEDPGVPYVQAPVRPVGENRLGVNCWLGARVTILKNVTVGWGSVIGAGVMLRESVPPFSLVAGQPARVLRRYSYVRQQWCPVENWTAEDEASLPDESEYLRQIRDKFPRLALPLPAASSLFGDY